jgi:Region found in RelA / SpoT proteins.
MDLPVLYNNIEEWNYYLMLYNAALKEMNTKLEILYNEFKMYHQYNPIEHITSRIKTPQSIAKKLKRYGKELTIENIIKYVNDVAGIRIICSFVSDVYKIADLISHLSDIKVLKIKDYIANPKPNGYTSYHMIVSVPVCLSNVTVETKVEIQIRTIAMDVWASLEHKICYKYEGDAPEHIRKELKTCSDIIAYLDQKMLSINEEIQSYSALQAEECNTVSENRYQIIESIGTIEEEDVEHKKAKKKTKKEKKQKEKGKKQTKKRILLGFGT